MQDHCSPELIEEIVNAFNRKDIEAIVQYFAEDGVFRTAWGPAPGGHSIVGRDAIRKYLTERYAQFPDWQCTSSRNWCASEFAVAEWTVSGTNELGERFAWLGCDVIHFENGKMKLKDTFWKSKG